MTSPEQPRCWRCGLAIVWEPLMVGGADWCHVDWPQDHAPVVAPEPVAEVVPGATFWSGTAGNMPVVDVGEAVDRAREAQRERLTALLNEPGYGLDAVWSEYGDSILHGDSDEAIARAIIETAVREDERAKAVAQAGASTNATIDRLRGHLAALTAAAQGLEAALEQIADPIDSDPDPEVAYFNARKIARDTLYKLQALLPAVADQGGNG